MRRRAFVVGGISAALAAAQARAQDRAQDRVAPVELEDGRLTQPWFLASFLMLRDDLAEAAEAGKRFAILWDQRGCPYCLEMQRVHLGDPAFNAWIRERFTILQLDLRGAREVTDFDGEALGERALARKDGVAITPVIQFFPAHPEELAGRGGRAREVARMPGLLRPPAFKAMFEYVYARGYEETSFPRWLAARGQEMGRAAATQSQ